MQVQYLPLLSLLRPSVLDVIQLFPAGKRVTVGNVAGGSRNDVEAVKGRAGRRPKRTVKHREILGPSRVAKRRAGVLVAAQQKTTPPKTPSPPLTTPFAPWISYVYPLILSWSRPSGTEFRYP
ncbi:Uncharacterized protein APZ42_028465 [Daphnia magna]|uniref:Uncharacterized protein n=1 Tax=Daphnia magna TaxID=35525 RepID=A0A164QHS1_9CRUS|nr:Uncharacterized protein APZ42_028465 [Daphnia magna]